MNSKYTSDVAIIMLNYYPPDIVGRAVASIRKQTHQGSRTLYLGFHNRAADHKEAVRRLCQDLPTHYVDIDRDLIFDVRARDTILQTALHVGRHRFLFFLDDDDEWYPHYLEKMTSGNAPFVTCAKDVQDDDTGETTCVADDIDYEGMGFHFHLWKGRHLPVFVKQVSDKYILREFGIRFPQHPSIQEPLYRIHRHRGSLTFLKSLGRDPFKETLLSGRCTVLRSPSGRSLASWRDCSAIAKALNSVVRPAAEFDAGRVPMPHFAFAPLLAVPELIDRLRGWSRKTVVVVALTDQPPQELWGWRESRRNRILGILESADALLLADPLWIEAYETLHPHCLPVGIPSPVEESIIRERCRSNRSRTNRILSIPGRSSAESRWMERALGPLAKGFQITRRLSGSRLCWVPDLTGRGWGRPILESFERGIPCLTSTRTAVSRILFGGSDLLVDPMDLSSVVRKIERGMQGEYDDAVTDALPFFRRCFGVFYWQNYLASYLKPVLAGKGLASP